MTEQTHNIKRLKLTDLTDDEIKAFLNSKTKTYINSLCLALIKALIEVGNEYDFYIDETSIDDLPKGENL